MPKAVVFDAFGTLLSPIPGGGAYVRLGATIAADRHAFRLEALTSNVTISVLAHRHAAGSMAVDLQDELDREDAGCSLLPEAGRLLARLDEERIPYAVCSNLAQSYGKAVRRLVPGAAAYIFSYEVGAQKPDPAIYAAACNALCVGPEDIVFVGDTPKCDVDGPRLFGMRSALVSRKPRMDVASVTLRALSLPIDVTQSL